MLRLFLSGDWSAMMHQACSPQTYWLAIYFVVQALFCQYILFNCFYSTFIFVYSDTYSQYAQQPTDRIALKFEKSQKTKQ